MYKRIAEFSANGTRILIIEQDEGKNGYMVFARVLNNWDLDDIDEFDEKEHAIMRFLYLSNRILLGIDNGQTLPK